VHKLQKWHIEPFERFHEFHHRCADTFHMAQDAVTFVQARPILIETLGLGATPEEKVRDLAIAEHNAKIAKIELDSGCEILHTQALVLLWSGLEALLIDFLAQWLTNTKEAKELPVVQGLKISLVEFETLGSGDRADYLLERLEEKLGSKKAGGIERFEILFRLFGMSSALDEAVVRNLLELSAVRNLLIHRRGIVDARFKSQCPWTKVSVGQKWSISHDDYHRYFDAVDLYVFEITQRLLIWHGHPRSGHKPTCRFHVHSEPSAIGT
jgi:hypothetical protein